MTGTREAKINNIVEIAGTQFVYDIEMEDHPSFSTNHLLAHNSANPVTNYGGEIYHLLQIIKPDQLGTETEFKREWCQMDFGPNK